MKSLAILSVGTALPSTAVTSAEAVQLARMICCPSRQEEAEHLPSLYRQTGIANRHLAFPRQVVDDILQGTRQTGSPFLPGNVPDDPGPTTAERMAHYVREAAPLAVRAARAALDDSGYRPSAVTHLVTVSCTGFTAPGVDCALIHELGLPATVERTNVGFMGCHGALNGLRVARGLAAAQDNACILVCAVELCGVHFHYPWNPKRVVANALFADGAAAVIGVPDHAAPADAWRLTASGACLFADSAHAMTWNIGDHGFEMTLATRVPEMIAQNLKPWLEAWLAGNGLRLKDIASWAVHPGGPRILTAVEEALGLTTEATADSRAILADCGNMSSPTILFILKRLRDRNAGRPCVGLGFGPGLAAEAALLG
jgi:predicted naringenin-chalcone synthase